MKDYQEFNADEVIVKDGNHEYCDICGRKLKNGEEVFITEIGQVACDITELLALMFNDEENH